MLIIRSLTAIFLLISALVWAGDLRGNMVKVLDGDTVLETA